jgi:hypothetical protein
MKKRVKETPARKTYASPKLVVFGKVSEVTQGEWGAGARRRIGKKHRKGGGGRGHGGSRS